MKRIGCSALALVVALGLGGGFAALTTPERQGVTPEDADAGLAVELERATSHGFVIVERGETEELRFVRRVPVAAGACVALVVASSGPGVFESSLTLGHPSDASSQSAGAYLDHRATCGVAAGEAIVELTLDGHTQRQFGATTLRYAILTGPFPAEPDAYGRLAVSHDFVSAMSRARAQRRAAAITGPELLAPRVIDRRAAALVPASRATHAARRALSGSAHTVPRAALGPEDLADPFAAPDDVEGPPELYGAAGRMRLLTVIDAGALGAGCARIALTHLDGPLEAVPVTRVALPSLEERTLTVSDPAIAVDELCPAEGLFVYGVPANVTGDYALSIGSMPAPAGSTPRPSTYAPTPLVLPLVRALRDRCGAGEDAACIELAAFASDGAHGAGTVADALDPACARGGGAPCAMLAGQLDPERDARRIETLERRACATGHLPSCMRRAASLRERGAMTESLQTYRFACARRERDACAAVALFDEWELAPAVEVPTPEALP